MSVQQFLHICLVLLFPFLSACEASSVSCTSGGRSVASGDCSNVDGKGFHCRQCRKWRLQQKVSIDLRSSPVADHLPPLGSSLLQIHGQMSKTEPLPMQPKAAKPGQGWQLDETAENLRWRPKTISVVLPCAEERELAIKTVQAVFKETPENVLHEIVVVDDGSNPPLSETHLPKDVQAKYKVLLKRHNATVGLIGAKKTGGDAASGDIVVFFDCHVGPQPRWHEDFLRLIGENYRRMVVPEITTLNTDDWTQVGGGGGMSKCYATWDGDFKWGGTNDMYMGMLSGGLAGLSKRWWEESGGYDDQMMGWGGENIDQGIRMWVCGGEIVAAPTSQVAHMWRTGSTKTAVRYKRVGDTTKNRARAMYAWTGEFAKKLDDFPMFADRKKAGGANWFGNMSNFQQVKSRLNGCHSYAWYLRRFKNVYEDAGLIPKEIFMIKEESSGLCLRFQGGAGTSSTGSGAVTLEACDKGNHRFYWHGGNRNPSDGKCCSGLRAWNTDQCLTGSKPDGTAGTAVCIVGGDSREQQWNLLEIGQLRRGSTCLRRGENLNTFKEDPCSSPSHADARWTRQSVHMPIETVLYEKAQREHPDDFTKLNSFLQTLDRHSQ